MSEKETKQEIQPYETKTMAVSGMATMQPDDQTEAGLALLEERVRVAKQQMSILLRLVSPSQIVVMDGGAGRETCYFTGGAADRILRMGFGMRFSKWTYEIKRTDKETTCIAKADLLQQNGDVYEEVIGMRSMEGFVRNERDLVKGAVENGKHRIVTDILGLRFLSKEDFKELGLDLDKLQRRVEFRDRSDESDPGNVPVVPFGKNKGKPITELNDRSLEWYIDAAQKNIADPEKKKWKAKEQKWLDALNAEAERRKGGNGKKEKKKEQKPPPVENEDNSYGPPPLTDEELEAMEEREPGQDG